MAKIVSVETLQGVYRNLKPRLLQIKFPVTGWKIPVHRDIFPVNPSRESLEKWRQHSDFLHLNRLQGHRNRDFPCKIPC
jgi:hypothetical protein